MMRIVLDMNGIIGTLEAESDAWVRLLRAGITHQVDLRVTETATHEAADDPDSTRRARRMRQVGGFPLILDSPSTTVNQLANDIYNLIFGTRSPTARSRPNREADARHVAESIVGGADVFVTLDQEILDASDRVQQRHGLKVRAPDAALAEISVPAPVAGALPLPNVLIRYAKAEEFTAARALVEPISKIYPDFDNWFRKIWENHAAQRKVATVDDRLAAVAISKNKSADGAVVKLSTFFVGDADRDNGVGQHLLFHEIRTWAQRRVRKAMVTVSSKERELVDFFRSFGFLVEGVSPRRYDEESTEIILARHFLYGEYDKARMPELARHLAMVLGCTVADDNGLEGVTGTPTVPVVEAPEPAQFNPVRICFARRSCTDVASPDDKNGQTVLSIGWRDGKQEHQVAWNELDIETKLYPLRLRFDDRDTFIIPIRIHWAKALFEWREPQLALFGPDADKRFLRVDNVYYFRPKHVGRLRRGSPVLFYVTDSPRQAIGIVGSALVESADVDDPESLFVRYGDLGIYAPADIQGHVDANGHAMAVRFTWFEAFEKTVPLDQVKRRVPNFNPISTFRISYQAYNDLRKDGGSTT
jgi:predicted GNAT family N-acyltransferase/predicted transcriptional regulator